MPEAKHPLKVFLCHASADKPKVRELYRYLRKRGIRPWFDEIDLVGGQDWQVEIPKAISTSDVIIICLTKNAVDKEGYIQKEVRFALDKALKMPEGRIFLIPARFEECDVPPSLGSYQWVDLFGQEGYMRIMRALKFRASQLNRESVELPKKDIGEENFALDQVIPEKEEREVAEKVIGEKSEEEKAAAKKIEHEAAEDARQPRFQSQAEQVAASKKAFSQSLSRLRLLNPKATLFFRIALFTVIATAVFWIGKWAMPEIISWRPMITASHTTSTRSLVAYYPFNGNANDESGNGNDGNVYGAIPTEDRYGRPDSAYEFAGENSYVVINNPIGTPTDNNTYTIALWAKANVWIGKPRFIVAIGDVPARKKALAIVYIHGSVNVVHYDDDWIFNTFGVEPNRWYHFVATYDGSIERFYVDGKLSAMGGYNSFDIDSSPIVIGAKAWGGLPSDGFDGAIDDVYFFNRVLTDEEIFALSDISME